MKPARIASLWGPVLAFMLAIYLYSLQKMIVAPPRISDKVLHATAYGLFGLLCIRATHGGLRPLRLLPTILALLLSLAYGGFDEWHQSRISWRESSAGDWAADAAGAILAVVVAALLVLLRTRKEQRAE